MINLNKNSKPNHFFSVDHCLCVIDQTISGYAFHTRKTVFMVGQIGNGISNIIRGREWEWEICPSRVWDGDGKYLNINYEMGSGQG